MIERDMFQERLKAGAPIYLHEFLYPVAQGYDSVVMNVDLEIGGNDQLFNMMAGRTLMKTIKGKEKYVLTTKLLVDKEGKKVGKTTGNALFLDSQPQDFYAGIMSFPDEVIYLSYELLTEIPLDGIKIRIDKEPMGEKKNLAFEIVKFLWGEKAAEKAQDTFQKTFQERAPEFGTEAKLKESLAATIAPFTSLKSVSEAKRLIKQSAVDVNSKTITDPNFAVNVGDEIKVGARVFLKVV
jgi:tyrosyl-tRNA synthetase